MNRPHEHPKWCVHAKAELAANGCLAETTEEPPLLEDAEDHKRALVNTLKNDIHTLQNDMSSRISMLLESLDELLSA